MNDTAAHPPSPKHRGIRTERLILLFVLLVLATLVATPVLVDRRVSDLRRDIQGSEPARTLVTSLQFNLVREMAALTEAMLSGDTAAAAEYDEAVLHEDSLYRRLEPLIRQLGPDVVAQYQEVRRLALLWHDRAADAQDLLAEGRVSGAIPRRRERRLFDELLDSTGELDATILRRSIAIREEIAAAERVGLWLSIGLAALAIVAGGAAAVLSSRARRFAWESERRRVEAERALEELGHATELRERLLRGITHDVKNPLGAAKGFADLLLMGIKSPIQPDQVPLVTGIQRSVDGALEIIGDLLDVARADSGRLTVERVETDLAAVVAEAVDNHRAEAESAGHALRYQRPDAPLRLHTDPARVRQIVQNLLSNAVKYTPAPGIITVSVGMHSAGDGGHGRIWAAVRVSDTGPGVPAELREGIFDEFARLHEGSAIQGHGLGLTIARRIARLLGGDLTVVDSSGPGATFLLQLPLRAQGDVPKRAEES